MISKWITFDETEKLLVLASREISLKWHRLGSKGSQWLTPNDYDTSTQHQSYAWWESVRILLVAFESAAVCYPTRKPRAIPKEQATRFNYSSWTWIRRVWISSLPVNDCMNDYAQIDRGSKSYSYNITELKHDGQFQRKHDYSLVSTLLGLRCKITTKSLWHHNESIHGTNCSRILHRC